MCSDTVIIVQGKLLALAVRAAHKLAMDGGLGGMAYGCLCNMLQWGRAFLSACGVMYGLRCWCWCRGRPCLARLVLSLLLSMWCCACCQCVMHSAMCSRPGGRTIHALLENERPVCGVWAGAAIRCLADAQDVIENGAGAGVRQVSQLHTRHRHGPRSVSMCRRTCCRR